MTSSIRHTSSVAILAFLAPLAHGQGLVGAQSQRFDAPAGSTSATFGRKVSIDGDTLAVTGLGVVHVYERVGGTWTESAVISPVEPENVGLWPSSVAVDGDTLAIGGGYVPGAEGIFPLAAATIFERVGGQWQFAERIVLTNSETFGSARVALSGDVLALGEQLQPNFVDAGQVAIARRTAGVWQLEQVLTAPDASNEDFLGAEVAIDGDRVVAVAPGDDGFNGELGSVYSWEFQGAQWVFQQKLADALPGTGYFGWNIALDGDRMAVSRRDTASGPHTGSVHAYELQQGVWTETQHIYPQDTGPDQWFGFQLELVDDLLFVGANFVDGAFVNQGATYLFGNSNGLWVEALKLSADNPSSGARFGEDLSFDGRTLAIGTYAGEVEGQGLGTAYTFEIGASQGASYCTAGVHSQGGTASIVAFGDTLAANNDLHLAVSGAPPNRPGIFFFGPGQVQVPLGNGFRCVGSPLRLGPALMTDEAGGVYRPLDFSVEPLLGQVTAHVPLSTNFQFWFRDGGSSNLSDAVSTPIQ